MFSLIYERRFEMAEVDEDGCMDTNAPAKTRVLCVEVDPEEYRIFVGEIYTVLRTGGDLFRARVWFEWVENQKEGFPCYLFRDIKD